MEKALDIKRVLLKKIGVSVLCQRPRCGEVVKRGGAVFLHNGRQFCCRFCAEAFHMGKKFNALGGK